MNSNNKTARFTDISLRQAAIVAGFGLLIMTILAPFANFFAIQSQIVQGDAVTTSNNIIASEGLFRIGICGLLIVIVLDVVIAWALYFLLKPVNESLSLLAAWFRVAYAVIFAVDLNNLFSVLNLLGGASYLTAFETGQLHAQVMSFLNVFNYGWEIGLALFSLHLFVIGYLVFKSSYIPKILGILLIIAGLGYLIDSFGKFLLPNYNLTIAMYTFIGEALFMIWLLWKGSKILEMDGMK